MPEPTTAVLIVDDHPVVRAGLLAMLSAVEGLSVVGEAGDGAQAIVISREVLPDVVLLDLNLPDRRGEDVAAEILRHLPAVAVLVVTMEHDDARLIAALRAGVRGYVLKGSDPSVLVDAVRAVARGEFVVGPEMVQVLSDYLRYRRTPAEAAFPSLSDRERSVLALMAQGADNQQIARRLALQPKTVRNLVSIVLGKVQARDRADAILKARAAGFDPTP